MTNRFHIEAELRRKEVREWWCTMARGFFRAVGIMLLVSVYVALFAMAVAYVFDWLDSIR